MSLDSLITWAAHFGAGERIEFVCAEAPAPERGHRAWKLVQAPGCVADLPLEHPLELLALDVAEIGVRRELCEHRDRLDARLELWATLFAMADHELATPPSGKRKRAVMQAVNMPVVERRSLFGLGRKDPRPDDAWSPDTVDTSQQRLRAALRHLGAAPTEAGEAEGLGLAIVADGCRAAGQCVTACPHGALRLVHLPLADGSQQSDLTFDASLCDGCRRCIEFCDVPALSPAGSTSLNDLLLAAPTSIATLRTRRCERCRAPYTPEDEDATLCPVCAERRANPFGSSLPPEAIERLRRMREEGSSD